MKQNYFMYNGKKYDSGTDIIIKWCCPIVKNVLNADATFIDYDTETKLYTVDIYGSRYTYSESNFFASLCCVLSKQTRTIQVNQYTPNYTFVNELNIDGMLIAWFWYIFIMLMAMIFYDRIGIWILASIVFFNYRNKKLKEAGYK